LHYSIFLSFANSLHLPPAAVVCSANELHYQLCYTSIFCCLADRLSQRPAHIRSEISRTASAPALHYSIFLSFANSLHLPPAAVVCSANELICQLCYTSNTHTALHYAVTIYYYNLSAGKSQEYFSEGQSSSGDIEVALTCRALLHTPPEAL